jgi:hypothetical protein
MNDFLIGILSLLNQLLAILIILAATIGGASQPTESLYAVGQPWQMLVGGLIGFLAGLVSAGLVCGLIAAIVTISRELTAIRAHMGVFPVITEKRARSAY